MTDHLGGAPSCATERHSRGMPTCKVFCPVLCFLVLMARADMPLPCFALGPGAHVSLNPALSPSCTQAAADGTADAWVQRPPAALDHPIQFGCHESATAHLPSVLGNWNASASDSFAESPLFLCTSFWQPNGSQHRLRSRYLGDHKVLVWRFHTTSRTFGCIGALP